MRHLLSPLTKARFHELYAGLALTEEIVRESGLDWTVDRPPRLIDRPLRGIYRTAHDVNVRRGLSISRANVAHLTLPVLEQPETSGRAASLAS